MCDQLSADGTDFVTLGRTRSERGAGIVGDLAEPEKLNIHGKFDILVHMAPLWLLPKQFGEDCQYRCSACNCLQFNQY